MNIIATGSKEEMIPEEKTEMNPLEPVCPFQAMEL